MASTAWISDDAGNWNDATNWDNGVPDNTKDVVFSNSHVGNCVINATAAALTLTFASGTGYTGTLSGSSALAVSGNVTFASTMTTTWSGLLTINANATLETNNKTLANNITINGAGITVTLGTNNLNIGNNTFTLSNGSFDCNQKNITCALFTASGVNAGTFTYDSSTVACSGDATLTGTNLVLVDDASSTFSCTQNFTTKALTFNNLTITATANIYFTTLNGNITVDNNFTCTGSSVTVRPWIKSNTIGTQRTITCNGTVTITNCDFTDTVGAGTGTWSGTSVGNAGNNSGITFTGANTCTWTGGTGNANAAGEWSGSVIPIVHDSVVFDAGSFSADGQTCTWNLRHMPACDFSATDQTFNLAFSQDTYIFGTQTWDSNMTLSGTARNLYWYNRSAVNFTPVVSVPHYLRTRCHNTTVTLQGNLTNTYSSGITIEETATLDANDFNITALKMLVSSGTFVMGNGTHTYSGTGTGVSAPFYVADASTITREGSTIVLTGTGAVSDFRGAGKVFNNLTYSGNNALVMANNYNNTFATLTMDSTGGANTLTLYRSSVTTVSSFVATGSPGKVITINSDSAGTAAILSDSSGTNACDYLSLKDNTAQGGATWNATNSTVVSNVTGWNVTAPITNTGNFFLMF
jgi:hypothetical protein